MRAVAATLMIAALATTAGAQPGAPWNGTWHAYHLTEFGERYEAEVVLRAEGGTWTVYSNLPSKYTPCRNRPLPIVGMRVVDGKLHFSVDGNASLAGCPVFPVTVANTDADTLDGLIGKAQDRSVHMVRK